MSPTALLEAERALQIHTFHNTTGLRQKPNRWWIVDESYTPQESDEQPHLIVGSQYGYDSLEAAHLARCQLILERIGVIDLIRAVGGVDAIAA